jgi:peptidoglycan/LPS O-acetylase OafA/YrhL
LTRSDEVLSPSIAFSAEGREGKIYTLEALRGFAAMGVALAHFLDVRYGGGGYWEEFSAVCVEIFFPLSGYVLSRQLFLCLEQGIGDLKIFYLRRWVRTLPPYYFALACMALISEAPPSRSDLLSYFFFVRDVAPQTGSNALFPIAWSLAVEEYYYLLFPLFLFLTRRWRMIWSVLFFILVFQTARVILASDNDLHFLRTGTFLRLDSIALGFLANIVLQRWRPTIGLCCTTLLAACVCLYLISDRVLILQEAGIVGVAFIDLASMIGLCCVVLAVALDRLGVLRATGKSVAAFFGKCSYPMYLFHLLILGILVRIVPVDRPSFVIIYIAGTIGFAAAFHYFFERPILVLRPSYPVTEPRG